MEIIRNGYVFWVEDKWPFYCFKGAKVKAPPLIAPTATPKEVDEAVRAKDIERRRQRIAAAGRAGTILTPNTAETGKATLLGRSTS